MGEGVGIDVGRRHGVGMRARLGLDDLRRFEDGARPPPPPRTWRRTRRTTGAGCAARSGRSRRRPRTRWCRRCRGAPRSRRAARTARRGRCAARPTTNRTAGWRWLVPRKSRPAAASAATASGRTFDGPLPKRPSAGSRPAGMGCRGMSDGPPAMACHYGGSRPRSESSCQSPMSAASRPSPSRPPWPSMPRPRRSRPQASPSSASAPASPTSPRPAHIVEAAVEACRDPRNHKYTPTPGLPELREAIAAEDGPRLRLRGRRRAGAGHQRRQARRVQHLRHPARPRRRGAPARAVLDDLSRAHRLRRRRARRGRHRREQRVPGHGRAARRGADAAAPRRSSSCRRRTRPAPSTRRDEVEAIGRWAVERGRLGGHRRDLRAPDVRRPPLHVDAGGRARAGRHVRRPQRRGQDLRHDRLAGRLDDRPARRDQGGHQPPVARDVERLQRRAAGRPGRGDRAARRVVEMRAAFERRAGDRPPDAQRDRRASPASSPRARSTPSPTSAALLGREIAGRTAATTVELAEIFLDEAQVALVPGEAFGAPGYGRVSFALGDDDLEEGLARLTKLVAGQLRRGGANPSRWALRTPERHRFRSGGTNGQDLSPGKHLPATRTASSPAAGRAPWLYARTLHHIDRVVWALTKQRTTFSALVSGLRHPHAHDDRRAGRGNRAACRCWASRTVTASSSSPPTSAARHHPAWYLNLRAHAEALATIDGSTTTVKAKAVERRQERERLWALGTEYYPAWNAYRTRAGGRATIRLRRRIGCESRHSAFGWADGCATLRSPQLSRLRLRT